MLSVEGNNDVLDDVRLSVADAAGVLGVSKQTVYRLVEEEEIGYYTIKGQIRIGRSQITEYLRRNRRDARVFVRHRLASA